MTETIAILGRQPALGRAELERLYGADALQPIGAQAVLVKRGPDTIHFPRLGGSVKLCKVLTQLEFTDWNRIHDYLVEHVPKHTCCYGPGKLTFGISTIGFKLPPKALERTGLSVKKVVRATDRPVRLVPTKGTELSSAQVLHNHMTDLPLGMELMLVRDGRTTWLAQTTAVQDIDAYAARDQARPKRDAKVGMLPPKLAQIIVNLAAGNAEPAPGTILLDPFCGTGVVLQEALLMGFEALGTDLEPRMVEYSKENLEWLRRDATTWHVEAGDATTHTWSPAPTFVACETYLGKPFAFDPPAALLREVMAEVNTIHQKFLKNIAAQLPAGTPLCLAVPAWAHQQGFRHLPVLDQLDNLGYTRVSFVHAAGKELIYHREGQFVGRELVVLIRK